jgi:hypothetical protein
MKLIELANRYASACVTDEQNETYGPLSRKHDAYAALVEGIKELERENAELLDALKHCAAVCAGEITSKNGLIRALEKARDAMQRAKETT